MHHIRITDPAFRSQTGLQDALHTQLSYSRALFEATNDAIVVTDAHGIISGVNDEMVKFSGWTRPELIGSNWLDLIANTVAAGIEYARALREERVSKVELVVKCRDGNEAPVSYSAAPIYDHHANPVGVFATLRDASDLIRLKQEQETKDYEVRRANPMKADFLATKSHELRTPLTAILGFSEALLCGIVGDVGDEQREYIQIIHDSGQQLLRLVSDILDLAKIDAGLMDLQMETADVTDVLVDGVTHTIQGFTAPRILVEIDQ